MDPSSPALRIFKELDGPLGRESAMRVAAAIEDIETGRVGRQELREEFATKADLARLETKLSGDITACEQRMRSEIAASEQRLRADMATKSDLALLDARMRVGFSRVYLLFGITLAAVLFTNAEALTRAAQLLHLVR